MASTRVRTKRVYEPFESSDGTRVLVDRLWPRGMTKLRAHVDLWLKDVAPSKELREWFGHDPARWDEFQLRYRAELQQHPALVDQLRDLAEQGPLTLIYAAHDSLHNDAQVLAACLDEQIARRPAAR